LAGNSQFKSGHVTGVITALTHDKRKLNLFTTTGLSESVVRNRSNSDVLFIDDEQTLMEPIYIEYDRKDFMKSWKFETYNIELYEKKQSCSLTFTPWAKAGDQQDFMVVKRDLNRIVGFWDGWVKDESGKQWDVKRAQGYVTFNYVQA